MPCERTSEQTAMPAPTNSARHTVDGRSAMTPAPASAITTRRTTLGQRDAPKINIGTLIAEITPTHCPC